MYVPRAKEGQGDCMPQPKVPKVHTRPLSCKLAAYKRRDTLPQQPRRTSHAHRSLHGHTRIHTCTYVPTCRNPATQSGDLTRTSPDTSLFSATPNGATPSKTALVQVLVLQTQALTKTTNCPHLVYHLTNRSPPAPIPNTSATFTPSAY